MDTVKAEKETAMRRYRRLGLRCIEACAALLVLSWCSARLPHAARLLRDVGSLILAPVFVFLLGNAIVLVLLAKFRHRASYDGAAADLYAEFLHVPDRGPPAVPELRRTRSAGARRRRGGAKTELRRAETVVVGRRGGEEERESVEMSPEEAEEFRRRVEAFIAKQRWFQEEEEALGVVAAAAWASASQEQLILAES